MADIYIGNIKGPQGNTGATGPQGAQGEAATISVGTVSTTAYGNTAQVTNSGTESEAVFDFVIPQGRPGEETTRMSALTLDTVTAQSAEYPIPATGETGAVVWGKVIKFFTDVKTALATKLNVSDVVNVLTSDAENKPLSAKMGKQLNSNIGTLNDALGTKLDLAVTNNFIQSSENLDSYTTPGKYSCLSASVAETLANCPIAYAFVLFVEYGMNNQYIKQTIYGYAAGGGTIPVFSRKNVSGAWSTWYGGEITSGKNMNTYEFPGRYVCNSAGIASSLTNCPTSSAFVLDVEIGMNKLYVIQTVSVYSVANIPIYKRVRTSGTWGNWVQIN